MLFGFVDRPAYPWIGSCIFFQIRILIIRYLICLVYESYNLSINKDNGATLDELFIQAVDELGSKSNNYVCINGLIA